MLPGSIPQGPLLGGLIFFVKYNGASLRPQIPRITLSSCESLSVRYGDDHSCAVGINLKNSLIEDHENRPKPFNFRERTGHVLPLHSNQLQETLNDLHSFTVNNLMKITEGKTKAMIFNTSHNFDFPPEITLPKLDGFLDVY